MAPGVPPEIEWLRLSQQKEAEGDFRAAVELLRRCVAKKPEVAAFHNRLGVLLAARLKDFGAAVPHLTRAVELQPGNETFRSNFGKIVAAAAAQPSAEKDAGAEGQGLWARLRRLL